MPSLPSPAVPSSAATVVASTPEQLGSTRHSTDKEDPDFHTPAWCEVAAQVKELSQKQFEGVRGILDGGFKKKVPSLVVLVKAFAGIDGSALITVKDPTGEMQGTLHMGALQEHPGITIGAVLVLNKV